MNHFIPITSELFDFYNNYNPYLDSDKKIISSFVIKNIRLIIDAKPQQFLEFIQSIYLPSIPKNILYKIFYINVNSEQPNNTNFVSFPITPEILKFASPHIPIVYVMNHPYITQELLLIYFNHILNRFSKSSVSQFLETKPLNSDLTETLYSSDYNRAIDSYSTPSFLYSLFHDKTPQFIKDLTFIYLSILSIYSNYFDNLQIKPNKSINNDLIVNIIISMSNILNNYSIILFNTPITFTQNNTTHVLETTKAATISTSSLSGQFSKLLLTPNYLLKLEHLINWDILSCRFNIYKNYTLPPHILTKLLLHNV